MMPSVIVVNLVVHTTPPRKGRSQMKTANYLQQLYEAINEADWSNPEAQLQKISGTFSRLKFPRLLADDIAEHEGTEQSIVFYRHPTKTDTLLYRAAGRIECWLHLNQEAITPTTHIRPLVTSKGYPFLTYVLNGRMVIATYMIDTVANDPTWFRAEHLRTLERLTLGINESVVLPQDQIHRIVEMSQGTIVITLRYVHQAGPDRDYHRQQHHFSLLPRRTRDQRVKDLIAQLRNL